MPREQLTYDDQLCPYVVEMVEGSALNSLLAADRVQRHSMAASAVHSKSTKLVARRDVICTSGIGYVLGGVGGNQVHRSFFLLLFLAKLILYHFGVPGFFHFMPKK